MPIPVLKINLTTALWSALDQSGIRNNRPAFEVGHVIAFGDENIKCSNPTYGVEVVTHPGKASIYYADPHIEFLVLSNEVYGEYSSENPTQFIFDDNGSRHYELRAVGGESQIINVLNNEMQNPNAVYYIPADGIEDKFTLKTIPIQLTGRETRNPNAVQSNEPESIKVNDVLNPKYDTILIIYGVDGSSEYKLQNVQLEILEELRGTKDPQTGTFIRSNNFLSLLLFTRPTHYLVKITPNTGGFIEGKHEGKLTSGEKVLYLERDFVEKFFVKANQGNQYRIAG